MSFVREKSNSKRGFSPAAQLSGVPPPRYAGHSGFEDRRNDFALQRQIGQGMAQEPLQLAGGKKRKRVAAGVFGSLALGIPWLVPQFRNYVLGRDGQGAPAPAPMPLPDPLLAGPDFGQAELEEHMGAYRQARFYHATKLEYIDDIVRDGMDVQNKKEGADAAEGRPSHPFNYLGGDIHTTKFYKSVLREPDTEHLRMFLNPGDFENLDVDWGDEANLAYRTPDPIPPEQIMRGTFAQQEPEKLHQIFSIVREFYPDEGAGVTVEEVKYRHFCAIRKGVTTHEAYTYSGKNIGRGGRRNYQPRDEGYESE